MLNLCICQGEDEVVSGGFDQPITHTLRYPRNKTPSQRLKKGISRVSLSPCCITSGKSERTLKRDLSGISPSQKPTIHGPPINLTQVKKHIRQGSERGFLTTRASCVINPDNPLQADREGKHKFGVRVGLSEMVPVMDIFLTIKTPMAINSNSLGTKPKNLGASFFGQQTLKREYRSAREVTFAVQESQQIQPKKLIETPQTRQSQHENQSLKFNREHINTVYSQEDDDKIPVRTIDLNRKPSHCELKLASSSKCRLIESNINQQSIQKFVYEESIVERRPIMGNFFVLITKKLDHHELMVAVENNIGFLLLIKRVAAERLEEISRELLLHKTLRESHPCIIALYQCVQNEDRQHLILLEYYEETLEAKLQNFSEADLARLSIQMLSAFEFLIERSVKVELTLRDIAHIHGAYKICNMEGWQRVNQKAHDLLLHYYKQLIRIIDTIYELRKVTTNAHHQDQSLMLKVFLRTLQEGTLPISTLRQHIFLKAARQ